MSRSCFGFVTAVFQRCFGDVSVMSRCCFGIGGNVLYVSGRSRLCGVMCGSCLGDALLMSRECRGDVSLMFQWCLSDVSVMSW